MNLSAPLLTTLNRCDRRFRLESTHRVLRIRPKELFDRLLREAVFALSNGAAVEQVVDEACTVFLETAARPGLEVSGDPFTLAQDFSSIFKTSLEAISRETLLTVKRAGVVKVGELDWEVQAFRDDSGMLHRWTSAERWDHDAQYREIHSWHVYGDCAATGQGMWLHVLDIGRHSRGHQITPWCRCFKHPAIARHFRFRHTDGTALEGGWKPVFYQERDDNDPKTWVDLMERDNVKAIHHLQIRDPHPEVVRQFRKDLPILRQQIDNVLPNWEDIPIRRTSCDLPLCPWQPCCFAPPGPVNIEGVGGFVRIGP